MAQTEQQRVIRDSVIVGLAMFAVFFGAGNLIFPPQIGFLAGDGWSAALVGLLITGMVLPVLSVVALGLRGGTVERLCAPIAPWFGAALLFVTMLGLAWLIAVPRTASVAFETGFRTLAPALDPKIGIWAFVPLFFGVSTYFALDRSRVIDRIGRVLTPLLLGLLGLIVVWSVLCPLGLPADTGEAAPFRLGLLTGYQTGDVFGGIMFGIIFIEAFRDRGYTPGPRYAAALWGMALVTFLGLFFVYGGLEYLGATGSGVLDPDVPQAGLLTALVGQLAGKIGANMLAVAVLLACLTTAVGATAVLGEYIQKWTRGRVSYKAGVLAVSLTSLVQAFGGVDYIVALAEPIFLLLYPVGIAIVILGLLPRAWLNDGAWKGATILAILMGVYDLVASLAQKMGGAMPAALQHMHDVIPFSTSGFVWLLPALLGGLVGGAFWKLSGRSDAGAAGAERLTAE